MIVSTMTDMNRDADAAAAVAGSSASSEPLALVQGVQSALEAVHVHTGLPWWATLLVSSHELGEATLDAVKI